MKKYELTNETIQIRGVTLYRVRALRDFGHVKKGDLGGYIEKEENLSQDGNAWVSGNVKVYGNAKVSGNARVYDNARVYGDAIVSGNANVFGDDIVTQLVLTVVTPKHNITITDNHITIGCENHTIEHWKKHINDIGKKHCYSEKEIKAVKKILTGLLMMREEV